MNHVVLQSFLFFTGVVMGTLLVVGLGITLATLWAWVTTAASKNGLFNAWSVSHSQSR